MVRRELVSGAGESKGVGQKEPCKNKSTKPDVVQECLEAPLPITVFAEIKLINGREGRGGEAQIKNNLKAYMTRFNPKKNRAALSTGLFLHHFFNVISEAGSRFGVNIKNRVGTRFQQDLIFVGVARGG